MRQCGVQRGASGLQVQDRSDLDRPHVDSVAPSDGAEEFEARHVGARRNPDVGRRADGENVPAVRPSVPDHLYRRKASSAQPGFNGSFFAASCRAAHLQHDPFTADLHDGIFHEAGVRMIVKPGKHVNGDAQLFQCAAVRPLLVPSPLYVNDGSLDVLQHAVIQRRGYGPHERVGTSWT